ncbi:MAG: hypothetical protein WC812_01475 [Candidatus Pacearchaeota archaeon]|jgi:hypothetical protein
MTEKAIIFDAGTLISLSMTGLLNLLIDLKKSFSGKFLITKEVKKEVIDNPLNIQRFELEALQVQRLLNNKIIELPESLGISEKEITTKAEELMNIANSTFSQGTEFIHLIDMGETSCIALSKILRDKKIENLIAVDERTLRLLCEKPENLKELFKKKLHTKINYKKENLIYFKEFKIIRSCELIYLAYKKGFTELKGRNSLNAYVNALKFKGCSISREEIDEITKLG